MITPDKQLNALYALQGVLIRGRQMAYDGASSRDLADLLDSAEYLPWLMASGTDETSTFRGVLEDLARRHQCACVLQRFDDPVPPGWCAPAFILPR